MKANGFLCFIMVFAPVAVVAAADEPIAAHPDNPHYFLWRGRPTVLVTSGEHYGALMNLDFDFDQYFDELNSHGLNHTRTFSGVYRETADSFGITDNTLAPAAGRYVCPWARSDRPGYAGGGNKFDLDRWDPAYFVRLRALMSKARRSGVVVEMTLFCPMYRDAMWEVCPMNAANNVNQVGRIPRNEVYTLKHPKLLEKQIAFTRKIVAELRDFDNLYYEICNEPYFGGVTMAWQHRIIATLVDAEKDFPAGHLISLNVANGRQKVVDPPAAVSILNFHYCVPPDTVGMNYGLNRVIGENETGFRGSADVLYRTEAWDFLLAGGGLYNNLDYSFTAPHPAGTLGDYTSPGGGSRELRAQLGILKKFFDGLDFVRMRPDNSVIQAVTPNLTAGSLVQPGRAYAIYLHVPLPKKPGAALESLLRDDVQATLTIRLPKGSYTAEWLDTKTGQVVGRVTFRHQRGPKQLLSPRFSNDVALRVTANEK